MRTSACLISCLLLLPAFSVSAAEQDSLAKRLLNASPPVIFADPALEAEVARLAKTAIDEHCAACHGADLSGGDGVPNLVDYDWLWGVTGFETNSVGPVMEIMQTILYGIRNTDCPEDIKQYGACPDTRFSQMPAYGELGFSEAWLEDMTEWVLDLSGREADAQAVARAQEEAGLCAECHGDDGFGYPPYGGPGLADDLWLYGGSREEILDVLRHGREGRCPAWQDVLDPVTIKALAVYIYRQANPF